MADETSLAAQLFADVGASGTPLGHVMGTYVGFNADAAARERSASGGLASWFLRRVLERNIVDAVVAVAPIQAHDGVVAGYSVFTEEQDLATAVGSCYCATHIDEALGAALATNARIAVVGLPCIIKGLRLAALRDEALASALALTVGIVCGQVKTWSFLRRIVSERTDLDPAKVTAAAFRVKVPGQTADRWDVGIDADGKRATTGFPSDLWTSRAYTLEACDACGDAFAETADVVFMDAWAQPYSKDGRGHNFVLTRTPLAEDILIEGRDAGLISLVAVPPSVVEGSQRGVVVEKSVGLAYRLARWASKGRRVPLKRVRPDLNAGSFLERAGWALEMRIREVSARDHAGASPIGGARSIGGRALRLVRRVQPHVARWTERER